jgi:hypothetical protein
LPNIAVLTLSEGNENISIHLSNMFSVIFNPFLLLEMAVKESITGFGAVVDKQFRNSSCLENRVV